MSEKTQPLQIKLYREQDKQVVLEALKKVSLKLYGVDDRMKPSEFLLWLIQNTKEI